MGKSADFIFSLQTRRMTKSTPFKSVLEDQNALVILLHGHGRSVDQLIWGSTIGNCSVQDLVGCCSQREDLHPRSRGVISPDDKLGWNDCRGDSP